MLSTEEYTRYSRQISLSEIGEQGQEKLKNAGVLVIGAGGLGCSILQYLSAAGIGTIAVMDHDKVDLSNLQRQILFSDQDIGRNKAVVSVEKLQVLNPEVDYKSFPFALEKENILELFKLFDIIIDATDSFETKYLINDGCILTDKPMVYGSIYQFEGQVSVFNHKHGPSYRCVFPDENKLGFGCSETGVFGPLPGVVGTYQASEVLKIILDIGEVLSGKMKMINLLNNTEYLLEFDRNEQEILRVIKQKELSKHSDLA